ncbi:MAG: ATP-binding cassette domain-containing protein [Chlamydiia bacterium]|nr:ATP-binding cassette domain-containing protein [Chlamydiia bacterium]
MIKVKDLWKGYGKLQVLKGLNLEVNSGETLVILGRSGVGKSVLLRQIIGIESPDKGYVEVEGVNLSELNHHDRLKFTKQMGMLFQGAALFDSLNVGENCAFYLRQHEAKLSEKEIQARVSNALKMVDLEGTENKMPSDLSGGMRKRAALARLIVYRPHILLYDEPTTGLDPVTAMQINDLIKTTQKELEATSIVVTHDIKSAITVADRIAFHHDGKILTVMETKKFIHSDEPLIQSFFDNAVVTEKELA